MTFICMLTLAFSHVLAKTIASSLILCVKGSWLAIYMAFDVLLFFALKFARRDFTYWMNFPPVVSAFLSLVVRYVRVDCFTPTHQTPHSHTLAPTPPATGW